MKRRYSLMAMVFVAAMLASAIAIPASAQPAVNTFDIDNYQKEVEAGRSIAYEWVIFNNGTEPLLVETSVNTSSGEGWVVEMEQNFSAFMPGTSRVVLLQISTFRDAPSTQINLTAFITVVNMSNPSDRVIYQKMADTELLSLFGTTAGENKIFSVWKNTLPAPLDTNVGAFLVTLLLWIAIAMTIYFVVNPIIHQFTKKTKTELDDHILEVVKAPVFLLIVLFGLVDSLVILNIDTDLHILIVQSYQISLIFVVAWLAYRVYDKVVIFYASEWAKKSETELDDVLVPLLHKLGLIIIPLGAIITTIGALGYDITVLLAGAGILGIVIAFAAQETMSNFFAGTQLLLDRPFRIGDTITLESGEVCEVQKIGIRSTVLYNGGNNELIVLPNSEIASKKIINQSRPDGRRRISVEIGVAYGTEVEKVKRILLDIASSHSHVLKEKGLDPSIRLTQFADSSINFKLYAWVDKVDNQWETASDIREAIDKRFKEEGIEIPFPQQVVYYRGLPGGARN